MGRVITLKSFSDNFTYLYQYDQSNVFAVDPCDSSIVLKALARNGLGLGKIFVTHHHWDHVGGVAELKASSNCEVIGGDEERIGGIDRVVKDGEMICAGDLQIEVIATPGHTRTSVCYYLGRSKSNEQGIVWTGDTLFVAGCGRIFECTAGTMMKSLSKLASLPDETLVYCGHDYTVEDLEFALSIEPNNKLVQERLKQVKESVREGKQTVPSTILQERQTNPFLRAETKEIKCALNMPECDTVEVFAELRRRKDIF